MLLTKVTLKNFMKHEEITVDFEAGMNVLRGGNEQGKSSLLTGIAYNWFGAIVLPQSVDDTVTWGAKKTSLKTTTEFAVNGFAHYTCHRSASGAELYRDDEKNPLVTGHKEVSAAVASLFDLPSVAAASKLQIASQNDIRGVISLGATAAASFIEELIDMTDIDEIISDLTHRLTYSSDAKRQAIAGADSAQEQLDAMAKPVSTKKMEKEQASLLKKMKMLEPEVASTNEQASYLNHELKHCRSQQNVTVSQHKGLKSKLEQVGDTLKVPTEGVTQEDVEEAASLLADNNNYSFYTNELIPFEETKPAAEWEGTPKSLYLYVKGLENRQAELRDITTDLKIKLAEANAGIVTDTVCPTCGQDIADAEETELNNIELHKTIATIKVDVETASDELVENFGLLKEAKTIVAFQQKLELWMAKRPAVEKSSDEVVPFKLVLVCGIPAKPARVVTQVDFNKIQAKRARQVEAEEVYDENLALYGSLKAELNSLTDKLEKDKVDCTKLEKDKEEADAASLSAVSAFQEAAAALSSADTVLTKLKITNESVTTMRKKLVTDIAKWRNDAEEIQGNSDLISALRSARLDISSLLWQKLLGVTENYFSLFRGKPSTLSMSKKGILVDGHLSAPSGSTLDVLGLALRLAMSKLFSNNGLCILDEPSAGCDDVRTASMTAGLISAGFDQVILVTHKDVDEQAGNLIVI